MSLVTIAAIRCDWRRPQRIDRGARLSSDYR